MNFFDVFQKISRNFLLARLFWVQIFLYPVTLILEFDLFLENCILSNNFCTVSVAALILHVVIYSDNTLCRCQHFGPCDHDLSLLAINLLTLTFDLSFFIFGIDCNFAIIGIRAFIWHMGIFVTISFYLYQDNCLCNLDHLWTWPLSGKCVFADEN